MYVGTHILCLPDKKRLKNQKKSIRETDTTFRAMLIVSTFSVPVNSSSSTTNDTHAKRRKCVDFLRVGVKSVWAERGLKRPRIVSKQKG